MVKQKKLLSGVIAGVMGGLAAAWMMNEFMAGLEATPPQAGAPKGEAPEQRAPGASPMVPYAFGALTGGIYGGLAEYSPTVRSGFGTSFGGVLFSTADLLEMPSFSMGSSSSEQPAVGQGTPFAAHIVYGVTTEFVRRIVRAML